MDFMEQNSNRCFAKSLSLGMFLDPTKFVEEWTVYSNVQMQVFCNERKIKIQFNHLNVPYHLEFKFKDISTDIKLERMEMEDDEEETWYLTIPLKYPARFWKMIQDDDDNNNNKRVSSTAKKTRLISKRILNIPIKDAPIPDGNSPISVDPKENTVKMASWTVYRIKFQPRQSYMRYLFSMLERMTTYNLVPRKLEQFKPFITVIDPSTLPKPKTHAERSLLIKSHRVLYFLECNITANIMVERNLDDEFYDTIAKLEPRTACGILEIIAQNKQRVWNPMEEIRRIWNKYKSKVTHDRKIPNHCAMLRKVIVTPTTMYIQPPTLETTNRIVRHFKDYADRFLRVQFVEDGIMRIGAGYNGTTNSYVFNRVYLTLQHGIKIGDLVYEYLGFSSSQLREHGCWYFAPFKGSKDLAPMNANTIRAWMGDFSEIKVVAKHAARIGQCFSSTMPIIQLNMEQVEHIDDIKNGKYLFTDGVGNISYILAEEIARRLSLRVVPCAFQFRLGGAKGVLMLSNKLSGSKIQLRPSQIKFNSDHYMLEVVRHSTYIAAYLNRQAITLLSSLGVKDEVFLDMLDTVLNNLDGMLSNSATAIKVLLSNADEFGVTKTMAHIISGGFLERGDPYIANLLSMFRVSMLKGLKEKAKIHIPKGAFLLGVVDESKTLKENEIFFQISDDKKKVITGKCIVFRNPCFHPGDIRVLTAVDCPALHYLVDVLVFPAVGYRDIPSMCSGGDLDGDDYTVIWDEALMPSEINHLPMDYTPNKPIETSSVTTENIQKFFVNYMNNDNLGQIANAHLAMADQSSTGAKSGSCKMLAQLHSKAVDFPKTGQPATLSSDLKVKRFPDFMCKEDKPMYRSKKVLGKMYRRIDKTDYDEYELKLVDETVYDTRLYVPGMERYIKKARDLRYKYNRDLFALMNQYGVKTEAEIISGFVVNWLKDGEKKRPYEYQKQTAAAVAHLKQLWLQEFENEFKDKKSNKIPQIKEITQRQMEKAAAWYYVTYHPNERIRGTSGEGGFLSFPWVVENIIVDLARRNKNREMTSDFSKPIDEKIILQFEKENNEDDGIIEIIDDSDNEENNIETNIEIMELDDQQSEGIIDLDEEEEKENGDEVIYLDGFPTLQELHEQEERKDALANDAVRFREIQKENERIVGVDATTDELEAALL
ncbi:unnamed protein product [Cunninghamella echinulata]